MRIVLIGFMGTGKSSVAPLLAERLGLHSVDMDELIIKKAGGKSIKTIFREGGEQTFRELETSVAKDLQAEDNIVISTGGGVITNKINLEYLSNRATIVELSAEFDTLLQRISSALPRPLFENVDQAKALYYSRKPVYTTYADIQVATDNSSIEQVVDRILDKLKRDDS